MKKVNRSKEPTVRQMLNMAENLREKFDKSALVDIVIWAFSSRDTEIEYIIYVGGLNRIPHFKTWPELQDKYFELVK